MRRRFQDLLKYQKTVGFCGSYQFATHRADAKERTSRDKMALLAEVDVGVAFLRGKVKSEPVGFFNDY